MTGVGNVLSACICGPIGYSSVGKTMLCHSMGGHYYSGLFSIAYYCVYILFGYLFFGHVPLPVLGAFIFAIGMELLLEWLVAFRKKVSRTEYWETLILFTIMTVNFVAGFFGKRSLFVTPSTLYSFACTCRLSYPFFDSWNVFLADCLREPVRGCTCNQGCHGWL